MHLRQELGKERHEENSANDGIVEIKLGQPEAQRSVSSQEHPKRIRGRLLLVLLRVQHDVPGRDDAHRHLDQRPEGMEAGQVPDQWMHRLSVDWVLLAAMETSSFRVRYLLQERDARQGCKQLLQTVLGQLRNLRQHQRRHGEVRERQGRQEPGGLIPDLCFLGEPSLQHAEVQEGTEGGRGPGSVVPPLNLDEHRREEAGNHEVQRIVGHDPLPEEELRVG
mmetsp:Transcript_44185/g.91321  ORF Transcript_44185/g.91321 Transcript_44185/m.91321 type:complete len:222 (-) Transcript_44185:376-1041(-)